MASRRFEAPWPGESQCTPCPHTPPYLPWYPPPCPPQMLPSCFPIIIYIYTPHTTSLSHSNAPIHIVYQPCPPTPYFRFFGPFLAIPLLPVPSPIIPHPFPLLFKALHSLPGPFHPPAPAFPPAPIFAFLDNLWTLFCMYFFSISFTNVYTWLLALNIDNLTAFLGCNHCQSRGNRLAVFTGTRPQKKRPKIHTYSLIYTIYTLYGICTVGRLCGSLLQPAIDSRSGCIATWSDQALRKSDHWSGGNR